MRFTRLTAILVAAIATLTMVFTTAPVDAAPAAGERAGTFGKFNTDLVHHRYVRAHGNTIGWARKVVLIQRHKVRGGTWVTVARVRTDRAGRFHARLYPHKQIPCTGANWVIRAKKRGTGSAKIDTDHSYTC